MYNFRWETGRVLPEYQILLIAEGEGTFESAKTEEVHVQAGNILLLFPGIWHRYRPSQNCGWKEYWLSWNGERLKWHIQRSTQEAEKTADKKGQTGSLFELTGSEDTTYKSLGKAPIHIEEVVKSAKIPVGKVNASLVSLRLKGLVKQLPGNFFARKG